jgi:hypothetical protein
MEELMTRENIRYIKKMEKRFRKKFGDPMFLWEQSDYWKFITNERIDWEEDLRERLSAVKSYVIKDSDEVYIKLTDVLLILGSENSDNL